MAISWLYTALVILAGLGLILSGLIYQKKHGKRQVFVCPLRFDCHAVVYSPFAKFLGIPNEWLGMAYYGLIALIGLSFLFTPSLAVGPLGVLLIVSTFGAFVFSLYLTFIQISVIRKLCSLCLTSAVLTGLLFWLAMVVSRVEFYSMLIQYRPIILIFHLFGVALGLGGATLFDVFFLRYIKDNRITRQESEVLHTISQVIWFALGLLLVSGLALYLPEADKLRTSVSFLARVGFVGVIAVSSAMMHYVISPKLLSASFGLRHLGGADTMRVYRMWAYAFTLLSLVSWYAVFLSGILLPE